MSMSDNSNNNNRTIDENQEEEEASIAAATLGLDHPGAIRVDPGGGTEVRLMKGVAGQGHNQNGTSIHDEDGSLIVPTASRGGGTDDVEQQLVETGPPGPSH